MRSFVLLGLVLIVFCSCVVSHKTVLKVSVDPSNYDFGQSRINTDCNSNNFVMSNKGLDAIEVTSIELTGMNPGSFNVVATVPMNIASKCEKTVSVKFAPSDIGAKTAILSFYHSGKNSPILVNLEGLAIGTNSPLTIFEDDFSTRKGWTMTHGADHTGDAVWLYFASSNITGGSWTYLSADSNHNPYDKFDEYADSPIIDCSAYTSGTITLEFDGNYQDNDPYSWYWDYAELLVYDGNTWVTLDTYNDDWSPNGQHRIYYVSNEALRNPSFQISLYYCGWHDWWWNYWNYVYHDHYFKVDNVKLTHTP